MRRVTKHKKCKLNAHSIGQQRVLYCHVDSGIIQLQTPRMVDNMTEMRSAQNVDPEEIAKFEQLASRWWDPESEFKPLHQINPLRLNYIDERVGLAGKKVLDVGCGGGILSESMALRGADVTGIDMGEAPLSVARLHSMESGVSVDYRKIPVEELAEEMPGEFDVVTCLEMLEHVPDPKLSHQGLP